MKINRTIKHLPRKVIPGILVFLLMAVGLHAQGVYYTENGQVEFVSDAPLELIRASSNSLRGAVDLEKRTFAFSINNNSFKGFNSALQQEHFYENYIESHRYPVSVFQGKIIEDHDFSKDGTYQLRAKGDFGIHGITQEKIIKAMLVKKGDQLEIMAEFTVPLEDHDIKIPRIVYRKIAEVINVKIQAELHKREE
ncbi:MAG: YceI family protein [Bacteroidota bacterium]|nr:YceI family protein [Bacteroidota bacterium]